MPQATLQDLADRLGIARSTVSRALRDDPQVAASTRSRVQDLALEVGYRPNAAARALTRRRADAVGLMLPRTSRLVFGNPYFFDLLDGIAAVAEPLGWPLVVWTDAEPDPAAWLRSGRVDGLIALGHSLRPADATVLETLHREGRAIVLVHPPAAPCRVPHVTTDEEPGIAAAVAHLHALGHRRAVLFAGPSGTRYAEARSERWRRHAARAGVRIDRADIVTSPDTFDAGALATRALWRSGRLGPAASTVLLAGNDLMALGALDTLRQLALTVPEDLSVVGFDDVQAARWVGLATVRQCARELGTAAMAGIALQLGADVTAIHPALTSSFVARRSVGPAPSQGG